MRKAPRYRTLALCLTAFVIVANVTFWVLTNSNPGTPNHQNLALKSSGSSKASTRSQESQLIGVRVGAETERVMSKSKPAPISANKMAFASGALHGENILVYPELLKMRPRDVNEVDGRVIPNTVHYIWCGNRTFEYRHFLSVMAVWKVLEPDAIEFRYENEPREDKYNTWYSQIRSHLAVFQASLLPDWVTGPECGDAHGLETLHDTGGILIATDVVVGPHAANELLRNNFTVVFKSDMSIGLSAGRAQDRSFRLMVDKITQQHSHQQSKHEQKQHKNDAASVSSISEKLFETSKNRSKIPTNFASTRYEIVETLKSFSNHGSRIFYCDDTGLIKDLNVELQQPDMSKIFGLSKNIGSLCIQVDKRLQPRHVIEGNERNPLMSYLYRHLYGERRTDIATMGFADQDNTLNKVSHQSLINNSHEEILKESQGDQKYDVITRSKNIPRILDSSKSILNVFGGSEPESQKLRAKSINLSLSDSYSPGLSSRLGIPRLVHYVWFGAKEMTFGMYLSFLSTAYVVRPDRILIHGDGRLRGELWEKVKKHPLVTLVYRDPPRSIFSRAVLYTSHRSDVVRADVLDKYGGVYLDWDAYWLKSPEHYFTARALSGSSPQTNGNAIDGVRNEVQKETFQTSQNYKDNSPGDSKSFKIPDSFSKLHNRSLDVRIIEAGTVVSRDHIPRPPFPDTINMGVVLARPRSKFIRAWRAALVNYRSHDFLYNAVELPYKIYEMFPRSVVIDDRLQVMCYHLMCHPSFDPEFRMWNRAQAFNWKSDGVHAIHFTYPDPPAFSNLSALMQASGMFADIGRYIWGLQPDIDRNGLFPVK
ncbi:hypothetical protein PoB_005684200 [Plakobranchus ocellatus]|uniref:Uncharacterized protein n=1 Tax=Plakobranchus ocellatus TaxID=259542 RepID=A0AAV4CG33_9GAST|nr:hypothetical protein PoB_005684200 [Plakobranchus ocellatus]